MQIYSFVKVTRFPLKVEKGNVIKGGTMDCWNFSGFCNILKEKFGFSDSRYVSVISVLCPKNAALHPGLCWIVRVGSNPDTFSGVVRVLSEINGVRQSLCYRIRYNSLNFMSRLKR